MIRRFSLTLTVSLGERISRNNLGVEPLDLAGTRSARVADFSGTNEDAGGTRHYQKGMELHGKGEAAEMLIGCQFFNECPCLRFFAPFFHSSSKQLRLQPK